VPDQLARAPVSAHPREGLFLGDEGAMSSV
jgi:hypothetical protein